MAHPHNPPLGPSIRPASSAGVARRQHHRRRAAAHSSEDHQGTASEPLYRPPSRHQPADAQPRFMSLRPNSEVPRTARRHDHPASARCLELSHEQCRRRGMSAQPARLLSALRGRPTSAPLPPCFPDAIWKRPDLSQQRPPKPGAWAVESKR